MMKLNSEHMHITEIDEWTLKKIYSFDTSCFAGNVRHSKYTPACSNRSNNTFPNPAAGDMKPAQPELGNSSGCNAKHKPASTIIFAVSRHPAS